jgi:uncharacterized protein
MTYLADVNVWIALTIVDHVHHVAAMEWFQESEPDRIAFCRITQSGFLRMLTNRHIMIADTLSAAGAWATYDDLRKNSRIIYSDEPATIEEHWRPTSRSASGPNCWTDAYLAAFAEAVGFTIVTFDRAFRQFKDVRVRLLPDV